MANSCWRPDCRCCVSGHLCHVRQSSTLLKSCHYRLHAADSLVTRSGFADVAGTHAGAERSAVRPAAEDGLTVRDSYSKSTGMSWLAPSGGGRHQAMHTACGGALICKQRGVCGACPASGEARTAVEKDESMVSCSFRRPRRGAGALRLMPERLWCAGDARRRHGGLAWFCRLVVIECS